MRYIILFLAACLVACWNIGNVDITESGRPDPPADVNHDLALVRALLIQNNVPGVDSFPRGFMAWDLSTGKYTAVDLRGRGLTAFVVGPKAPGLRLRWKLYLSNNALIAVPLGIRFFPGAYIANNRICDPGDGPDVAYLDRVEPKWRETQICPSTKD